MEQCYEQKLGFTITKLLCDPNFFDFRNTTNIKDTEFIVNIQKFMKADQTQQRKFVIQCYDCFKNNDKVTEENLFCFLQIFERFYETYESTISWRGGNPDEKFIKEFKKGEIKELLVPTELLPLGSYDHDKFLDLFNNEFNKISQVLIAKRNKRLAKKAETEK